MFKKIYAWAHKLCGCVRNGAEKAVEVVSKVAVARIVNKLCFLWNWYFNHLRINFKTLSAWCATTSAALLVGALLTRDWWTVCVGGVGSTFFLASSLVCSQLSEEQEDKK
jgi:hypothetical protein